MRHSEHSFFRRSRQSSSIITCHIGLDCRRTLCYERFFRMFRHAACARTDCGTFQETSPQYSAANGPRDEMRFRPSRSIHCVRMLSYRFDDCFLVSCFGLVGGTLQLLSSPGKWYTPVATSSKTFTEPIYPDTL